MDWETSLRLLTTEMNRSSQTDLDMAAIALVNAMDFYKSFPFNFNHGFTTVHLAAGQEVFNSHTTPEGFPSMRVGMPGGMIRPIVIQIVGLVSSGDILTGLGPFTYTATGGSPLKQISVEEMAQFHQGVGDLRTTVGGYPEYWAWMGAGSVRLYPVPFNDMVAAVYFLADAHRPRYRWGEIGGQPAWVFEQLNPQTGTGSTAGFWQWGELQPTFTNLWLTHAEALIRARARLDLYMNMYGDAGAAQVASASLREQENRYHYEGQSGMAGTNPRRASSL
jgi:hypothetical protein